MNGEPRVQRIVGEEVFSNQHLPEAWKLIRILKSDKLEREHTFNQLIALDSSWDSLSWFELP